MRTIDDYNFSGKTALIRVDFNVPLNEKFEVTDDTRIRAAIPTIKKIIADGGRVVLMSHLGRPKHGAENKFSLQHVVNPLAELLGQEVAFVDDCVGDKVVAEAKKLNNKQVLLLENLRFYKQETAGTEDFAQQLALLGDIYVNDAFGTAHRAHASTTVVAKFFKEKCFGYVMANELKNIDKVLNSGNKPVTAIIGGAKVSGKILIINQLLDKIDNLIIGGGMAYTFIKAQGGSVGASLVEDDKLEIANEILVKAKEKSVNICLPMDTVIADKFDNEANQKSCLINEIPDGWMGLDIGMETELSYADVIEKSSTILWNGPMGVFEFSNFESGTKKVAEAIVKATKQGAFSLVGGGDSVAATNKFGLAKEVSYVSTGGGAMLEYLEGKVLPGVNAISLTPN